MTTKEILQKARDLLAMPGKWTKNQYARNAKGESAPANSPEACQFCALGAVMHLEGVVYPSQSKACLLLSKVANDEGIVTMNDSSSSVEPVLALYDKAIALCD